MHVIELQSVSKHYVMGQYVIKAIDEVNLTALDRDEPLGLNYARADAADQHPDFAGAGPQ